VSLSPLTGHLAAPVELADFAARLGLDQGTGTGDP
jgi:hypothetical protein